MLIVTSMRTVFMDAVAVEKVTLGLDMSVRKVSSNIKLEPPFSEAYLLQKSDLLTLKRELTISTFLGIFPR